MSQPDENVLVVRRSLFDELGSFHGLTFEPEKYLSALLSRGNNFFLPRAQAESDPSYKQIIPYALIAHGDTVLHYVRGKRAGEQRLVAKGSIGIGGHMNEDKDELLWNFEKFLVSRSGEIVARFAPDTKPSDPALIAAIEAELAQR